MSREPAADLFGVRSARRSVSTTLHCSSVN
jgi:hypothetical protein